MCLVCQVSNSEKPCFPLFTRPFQEPGHLEGHRNYPGANPLVQCIYNLDLGLR